MSTIDITYYDGDQCLIGKYVHAGDHRPSMLIAPDWTGLSSMTVDVALRLKSHGYNAFAMDIYGNGKRGQTKEEKNALMTPFVEDRTKLSKRLLAALDALKQQPGVSPHNIGILGFCFGGLCALDLARSGADIKAAISFHGLLFAPPPPTTAPKVTARVLALHGHDDPMVPPTQVASFAAEMSQLNADWQLHTFGNTMHAFTNPEANDASFGTVYNEKSAKRSWEIAFNFLDEAFQ